jgi:hypothetical protein
VPFQPWMRHRYCNLRILGGSATMVGTPSPPERTMSEVPTGASPNARFLAGQVPSTTDETARFVRQSACRCRRLLFLLGFLIIANLPSPAPAADPNPTSGLVFIATPVRAAAVGEAARCGPPTSKCPTATR